MTTWEILRLLLFHGTNIYWRKFFIFLIFTLTLTGGILLWRVGNKVDAAFDSSSQFNSWSSNEQKIDIIVTKDGEILTKDKNFSKALKILPETYELKIIALDSPGIFISRFKAIVHLPGDVNSENISQRVYAVHGIGDYNVYIENSKTLVYEAINVEPSASFTIEAQLPKTLLDPPLSKKFIYTLSQVSAKSYLILAVLLPLVTLIVMFMMIIRRRRDRFFYSSPKIINQPPSNIPPAVVGALMDGHVGSREIAATLIDLAGRGYLFITRHENGEYSFGKRKSLNLEVLPELRAYERILLSKIFEPNKYKSTGEDVELRVGRHIFSRKIAQVYLHMYNEATSLGYFVQNPVLSHLRWRYAGIASFFLGLAGFIYTALLGPDPKYILFLWVGEIATALVIVWLSGLMPVRSVTGTGALRQWMQFRQYLKMNRRIDGIASYMDLFNRYLPYAIVFGVEADWAKRFLKENFAKPDWYESDDTAVTLESFIGELFPLISFIGGSLDKSHEPTVA